MMCVPTPVGSRNVSSLTSEMPIVKGDSPRFMGLQTCSRGRSCPGCVAWALLMWSLAVAGVGGFAAALTAVALQDEPSSPVRIVVEGKE